MPENKATFVHYFRWEGWWWYWTSNDPKATYRPGSVGIADLYTHLAYGIPHKLAKDVLHEKFPGMILHRARPYHEGGNWKGPSMGSRPYKFGHRRGKEVETIRGYEVEDEQED